MRKPQEQLFSALCHLFNAIPLWGLLFCGWVWFRLGEESRPVVRQAQQAMAFHVLMMCATLVWIMLAAVSRVLNVLSPPMSRLLGTVNNLIACALLAAYIAVCLYGCVRCLMGHPFHYPLVNRRAS